MALPNNDHHVHSDGYFSEMGEADEERMMEELADEIEVTLGYDAQADVGPDAPFVRVDSTDESVDDIAHEWDCRAEIGEHETIIRPRR